MEAVRLVLERTAENRAVSVSSASLPGWRREGHRGHIASSSRAGCINEALARRMVRGADARFGTFAQPVDIVTDTRSFYRKKVNWFHDNPLLQGLLDVCVTAAGSAPRKVSRRQIQTWLSGGETLWVRVLYTEHGGKPSSLKQAGALEGSRSKPESAKGYGAPKTAFKGADGAKLTVSPRAFSRCGSQRR